MWRGLAGLVVKQFTWRFLMKRAGIALMGSVLLLTSAVAIPDVRHARAADGYAANARQALAGSVHELNADGQTLSKVMDALRNISGTNIVVNWSALEQAGVTKETVVTLAVREVPL